MTPLKVGYLLDPNNPNSYHRLYALYCTMCMRVTCEIKTLNGSLSLVVVDSKVRLAVTQEDDTSSKRSIRKVAEHGIW